MCVQQRLSVCIEQKLDSGMKHGGLNQEKYLKLCLGLGPIFFESTTPEVFKNTFREIADFRPSETLNQVICLINFHF